MIFALLVLALVILLVLADVPVGFSFGIGGLLFVVLTGRDISYLVPAAFWQVGGFALLALPLFIISGSLMGASGISDRLIDFVNSFVGRFRGGLGAVTVISCALFGAISGSGAAAIAAVGSIMIPKMVAEGYPRGYATALVGCSSVISLLIPPSIPMIVFALTSGLSVAACFLATIFGGVLISIIYCVLNFFFLRNVETIAVAPKLEMRAQIRNVGRSTKRAFFALLMPLIMLGGIYGGIFTPTEAAAVALVYTLPVGFFIYRGLTVRSATLAIAKGALNTGAIVTVLFFLFVMSRALILEQIPETLATSLISISENKYVLLLMINCLLILIGMIVDDISGSILASILLMPVALKYDIDPIHFAAIVGVNLGMGNITPPTAPLLYMTGAVGNSPLSEYIGPTMKFLLFGHLPVVIIVTYFPDLSLYLPRLLLNIN